MSAKSTVYIKRAEALDILLSEIPTLPNSALEELMDTLADSRQSRRVSQFDNFIISEFTDRNGEPT